MNVCVLPEFVATSPSQEHSIYGDMEDPSMGSLNKVLEIGNGLLATTATELNGGFGVVHQTFGLPNSL